VTKGSQKDRNQAWRDSMRDNKVLEQGVLRTENATPHGETCYGTFKFEEPSTAGIRKK